MRKETANRPTGSVCRTGLRALRTSSPFGTARESEMNPFCLFGGNYDTRIGNDTPGMVGRMGRALRYRWREAEERVVVERVFSMTGMI